MVMGVLVSLSDVFSPKAELLIQKEFEDFKWDGEKQPVWLALVTSLIPPVLFTGFS